MLFQVFDLRFTNSHDCLIYLLYQPILYELNVVKVGLNYLNVWPWYRRNRFHLRFSVVFCHEFINEFEKRCILLINCIDIWRCKRIQNIPVYFHKSTCICVFYMYELTCFRGIPANDCFPWPFIVYSEKSNV